MTTDTPEKPKRQAGRPKGTTKLDNAHSVRVYLDAASIEKARVIGCGNVSAGIRAALEVRDDRIREFEADVARLNGRLKPHMDNETGTILDAVDLAEFRETIARQDAEAAEVKLLAVEGLPDIWRSLNESRHDPNNAIRCAAELEAALRSE